MPIHSRPRASGRALLASLAFLGLSACGGDPTLYTLAPTPGATLAGGPSVVEVRTPVVSTWLDRDEIVRQDKDYKLEIAKGDAWSEPLASMIGHTLSRDLSQRLPGTTVFAQNDAVATTPGAYVELTITGFNEDQKGNAQVQGMLSTHLSTAGIGPVMTTPIQLQAHLDTHATGHLVAALSTMLGTVADQAADRLRALPVLPAAAAP